MSLKRIVSLIILVPVAIILIMFIVANREMVALTLNPFTNYDKSLTFTAPFFVWLFAALAIGIIIGSITTWLNQRKYRKALHETQQALQQTKTTQTNLIIH